MLDIESKNDVLMADLLPNVRQANKRKFSNARGDQRISVPQFAGATIRLRNNQMIFNEGDEVRHFYKLMAGRVRLCKVRCNGRRQIIELLIPGDIFGFEFSAEYPLIAEAAGKVVLERYPFHQIERLSEGRPDVPRYLMTLLQRNLSAVQNHMVMLGRQTAKERVAAFLASFAVRLDITRSGVIDLGVARQDVADYVGLALETVSAGAIIRH